MSTDECIQAVHTDGYVILRQVVDLAHVRVLREKLQADLEAILARPERLATQFTRGNIQQDPPPFPPYLFADVLNNEAVIAVCHGLLGDGLRNVFYSGNTNLPGSTRQPVHFDTTHIWPGVVHPVHNLAVNVPLVDFTVANGATEIWPGSHRLTGVGEGGTLRLRAEDLAARRAVCPPFQVEMQAGDVLVRDLRLWHAGMPNTTTAPRAMIAMVHVPRWWHSDASWPGAPMEFTRDAEPILAHPVLRQHARYVDGPVDYLFRHEKHDVRE
jgi:ectoine hydroxylase-related dioxygenase (phytanoyl-CoA dioxygenase family)